MDMFLTKAELVTITGRALKSLQAEQLRRMGVSFFVNASGRPVVPRVAIEGSSKRIEQPKTWTPRVVGARG